MSQVVYVVPAGGSVQPITAYPQVAGVLPVVERPKVNKLAMYVCIATAVTGVSLFWGGWYNQAALVSRALYVPSGGAPSHNFDGPMAGQVDDPMALREEKPSYYRRLYGSRPSSMSDIVASAVFVAVMGSLTNASLGLIISGIILTLLGLTGLVYLAKGDRKLSRRLIGVKISLFLLQIS